ncbi:uncharacterized protein LOC110017564 [Oryzias latipes]
MDTRHHCRGWLGAPISSLFRLAWEHVGVPQRSWRKWLGRGKSGHLCLDCCPHDPGHGAARAPTCGRRQGTSWTGHQSVARWSVISGPSDRMAQVVCVDHCGIWVFNVDVLEVIGA